MTTGDFVMSDSTVKSQSHQKYPGTIALIDIDVVTVFLITVVLTPAPTEAQGALNLISGLG